MLQNTSEKLFSIRGRLSINFQGKTALCAEGASLRFQDSTFSE